jgi:transposase
MRTLLVNRVRSYVRSRIGHPVRATPDTLPGTVRQALLVDPEGLPAHLERVLVVLETLRTQIASADAELKAVASDDARMRRLMTVPGVGPVTSARFVAALDDVDRFPNASSVASYVGLIPGEHTTGFRTKRTRLTHAGSPQVRWALGQAAWSLYLHRPRDPMVLWAKQVAARRGSQVAIVALARKLSHVLFAMWKHETTYDPSRSARAIIAA